MYYLIWKKNLIEIDPSAILYIVFNNIILSCKMILIGWETLLKNQYHPLNHKNHALTRDETWQRAILLDDEWSSKNIDCAEFMRVRITILDSDWCRMSVWIKYKLKYSLDLDCFETKRNVDDVDVYLINSQYNIINIDCTRRWHGKLSPRENGVIISHVILSCSHYLYNVIGRQF